LNPPVGRTFVPGEVVDLDALWTFQFVSDLLVERRGPGALQAAAIYRELDNGAAEGNRLRWVSAGARPVYRLGRFTSVAAEVGWDHTARLGQDAGSLFKLTIAPQITPESKFLSRPSLRAFLTWATWSDSFEGGVAPLTYGNATHGLAAGVQLESWW
jgi:maltoporin